MVKVKPLSYLPNLITLSSLFCGCIGIVWALDLNLQGAVYMIWACAILDLLDGLAARILKVSSELGKQLDSLSDLIAFGLLPATIIYVLSSQFLTQLWPYMAFLITVFSALRLGRFNLDTQQTVNFKGLPVPANAILISSFPVLVNQYSQNLRPELENPIYWLLIIGLLSYLLVSNVSLFGFKFQNLSWSENKFRFLFIGFAVILGFTLGVSGIPWIMLMYVALSLVWQYQRN
ncbi:MAG: CDP-diacylglycerol--serine O-phosphatidyltransferase [Aurantibacter sp.]